MEGFAGKAGAAARAFLKADRWIQNIPTGTRAFTWTDHL